uniref:Uncharacterized protein n=1 Tax=Arundo donax TaxID=35708 RepID=A0A0A8Z381_ARUDO
MFRGIQKADHGNFLSHASLSLRCKNTPTVSVIRI